MPGGFDGALGSSVSHQRFATCRSSRSSTVLLSCCLRVFRPADLRSDHYILRQVQAQPASHSTTNEGLNRAGAVLDCRAVPHYARHVHLGLPGIYGW